MGFVVLPHEHASSSSRPPGLRLRWLLWRNRVLASARFQAWAARNPLTRPIARRRARDLFDLTAGFVYSQVAAAMVESGLIEALADRPLSGDQVIACAGLDRRAAATLLRAAAALDLVQAVDGVWTLGQRGAVLAATPGLADMIRHHRLFYADLADPLAVLRAGGDTRLAALWRYDGGGDTEAATYSRLMSATQPMVAAQAIAAYSFRRHERLLDIGGGEGAFLATVSAAAPQLELGLFDRPAVSARADGSRITVHAGNFLTDTLPEGYDLHTLVRVLHDHDDGPALRLLKASHAALSPGGRLLIIEPMATAGSDPEGHAYFGLYLAAMKSGRPREPGEIRAMLREAGFRRSTLLPTPLPLVARCIFADQ